MSSPSRMPLMPDADNIAAPGTIWDDASAAYQARRAEALRDLGMLSDAEMAKAEYRLKHFNTVSLFNPFTGEKRKVTI